MKGLEKLESSSRQPAKIVADKAVINQQPKALTKGDKAMGAIADNFEAILGLAGSIVEIQKMRVASQACLAKMEEDRKRLLDEATAYVMKKNADTSSVVERMNIIRYMMQDFYAHNQGNLSGDDFCKIITEVVNQMGRIENGIC